MRWEPVYCNICGSQVSTKKSARLRIARPEGGYDHAHCSVGLTWDEFRELDRSVPRSSGRRRSEGGAWVRVAEIEGGWIVWCRLCGSKNVKRRFMAADTNHAEALRLATAFEAGHRYSQMHALALGVFRADAPQPAKDEALIREIFGKGPTGEHERRMNAVRGAVARAARKGLTPVARAE